jgi:hypothetical protein
MLCQWVNGSEVSNTPHCSEQEQPFIHWHSITLQKIRISTMYCAGSTEQSWSRDTDQLNLTDSTSHISQQVGTSVQEIDSLCDCPQYLHANTGAVLCLCHDCFVLNPFQIIRKLDLKHYAVRDNDHVIKQTTPEIILLSPDDGSSSTNFQNVVYIKYISNSIRQRNILQTHHCKPLSNRPH